MSPQSTLRIAQFSKNGMISNAIIARAADEAFNSHRLDQNLVDDTATSVVCNNPLSNASPARFTLRKRKISVIGENGIMTSRFSTSFLSGIFADIHAASSESSSVNEDDTSKWKDSVEYVSDYSDDSCPSSPVSRKKSRISMTRSISRNSKSYRSLGAAFFGDVPFSPCSASPQTESGLRGAAPTFPEEALDAILGGVAFPHLPPVVSESSCSSSKNLTQSLALHAPDAETNENAKKESYGWFVVTDELESTDHTIDAYKKTPSNDLAFSAVTAPKCVDHDAEVEWAKAADTVDSVLGDFF